jgi:hypothetical protein
MDNKSTNRQTEVKKTYRKPKLTVHGTLAQLTRGEDQVHTDGFYSGGADAHS